ncbi:MAG: hypothetical protein LBR53_07815 [Deltaproteobacteria bacterium]|jgi:hypothetical protein|nr:hypothetical protein [Deltaproteobacteria bacterium]
MTSSRLVIVPEIFPAVQPKGEDPFYLSWPSWEGFLGRGEAPRPVGDFPRLRTLNNARPLLIPDPPNFTRSFSALIKSGSAEVRAALLEGPPFPPAREGDLKRQILSGRVLPEEGPDRGYLLLALHGYSLLEEEESNRLTRRALAKKEGMLRLFRDPAFAPEENDAFQEEPEEDSLEEREADLKDGWEEDSGDASSPGEGRIFSEKQAATLLKTWFRLGGALLRPGDRLLARRPEFRELLEADPRKIAGRDDLHPWP